MVERIDPVRVSAARAVVDYVVPRILEDGRFHPDEALWAETSGYQAQHAGTLAVAGKLLSDDRCISAARRIFDRLLQSRVEGLWSLGWWWDNPIADPPPTDWAEQNLRPDSQYTPTTLFNMGLYYRVTGDDDLVEPAREIMSRMLERWDYDTDVGVGRHMTREFAALCIWAWQDALPEYADRNDAVIKWVADTFVEIAPTDSVVVMTGAGVSAESGIPTFRDQGGLWHQHDISEVATPEGFAQDPALVWRFYSQRREGVLACAPNAGHRAIANLLTRQRRGGGAGLLVSQNVDGLHERAETPEIINIHGSLFRTRCSDPECDAGLEGFYDSSTYYDELPRCQHCAALLRPGVVWFGEMLDIEDQRTALAAIDRCDLFLAVGTSGTVYPVAGYVQDARMAGATTILVNLAPPENVYAFDYFYHGKAQTSYYFFYFSLPEKWL